MNTAEPSPEIPDEPLVQLCPACATPIDVSDEEPLATITCPACGAEQVVSGHVDQFELQQVVGRGGMGVVYKAYDAGLDRHVALKLLRRDQSHRAVIEQFEKEAAVTASINHPHVVRVFTSGTDHGRFFIAMELVDKGTLDDLIHLQGRIAEAQVLEVGIQIAQGLRAAFQAGLIHRDVKPGNILFADAHTAKIVDFGLAIMQSEEEAQRGEIWGTPYYVAPEKLDKKPEDFRSDMYSLGGTLFHALAGRPPFEAENASLVALKHLKSQAVSLQAFAPHVSGETAYVINRTLAKDPNDRYQSYDELIEHLGYALENLRAHGGQAQPRKRLVIEGEESQRAMGWVTAAMFGLILLVGVGLFAFRKQIFGGGASAAAASPAPGVVAATGSPFPAARKLLADGDTAAAIALLQKQTAQPGLPPLQQAWGNILEALAHFLASDSAGAKKPLQAVIDRPTFDSKGEEEKVDFFLRNLAADLITPEPPNSGAASGLSTVNYEALTIFAYGVKDWALGKLADARPLLSQFRQSAPAGPNAWIAELKPVATELLEQQAAFAMAADHLKAARRAEQYQKALAELQKLKGPLAPAVAQLLKTVPPPPPLSLPKLGEWTQEELGQPDVLPDSAVSPAGEFTIRAGGTDIWGTADSGLFVYRLLDGDGEIIAHVVSATKVDTYTKAGVMIRDSLSVGARNVAVMALPGGVSQQVRAKSGGATTSGRPAGGGAPCWLKLVRKGDDLAGFRSADGMAWTPVSTAKITKLPASVYVGMAVCAHSATAATTARFDQVQVNPAH